mmetsp:Transcript_22485/g.25595  ORF Transcript_22485/g.25595 Transcript_22485/m.25595 type:complete len:236 (+) Transcript_22485:165-872(+)|eukprot:CAMPEP_0194144946 /NCGR_PEP_ID=MMETSP0152-20130528/13904_1 /TAXON_ID=1049557 /ORGANISM="Thalassiothrix antarctica, Strain L6-D1" /LENGTH=235 /DNA_ID=CAMNT_0038844965 /DNA_START=88 /DNA_END=795 /DNA_ORIENTATION=-
MLMGSSSETNYYKSMKKDGVDDFHNWDVERLGVFFRKRGLGNYNEVLRKHNITGKLAPLLNDDDLKEMGINIVGDRLMFKHHLQDLARRERYNHRIESLWEGKERVFFSELEKSCATCCGFCPVDPSSYKLTTNHLRVKKVRPVRCGPIVLCCFGPSYVSSNIDLSKVDDVDVVGVPAPCCQRTFCCASGKDLVEVESRFEKDGKTFLTVEEGHGDKICTLILNQVEESQKIERN